MSKVLPARLKLLRSGSVIVCCPGVGCEARLAKTQITNGQPLISLETRYTTDRRPGLSQGVWWRRSAGGYKGMPRARDIRKHKVSLESIDGDARVDSEKAVFAVVRHQLGMADPELKAPMRRRDTSTPRLPAGGQDIECYQCCGLARIDPSAVASYYTSRSR